MTGVGTATDCSGRLSPKAPMHSPRTPTPRAGELSE